MKPKKDQPRHADKQCHGQGGQRGPKEPALVGRGINLWLLGPKRLRAWLGILLLRFRGRAGRLFPVQCNLRVGQAAATFFG